jgi:hypothetical protein
MSSAKISYDDLVYNEIERLVNIIRKASLEDQRQMVVAISGLKIC